MRNTLFIALLCALVPVLAPAQTPVDSAAMMQADLDYLSLPYSRIESMRLTRMRQQAPAYSTLPGYDAYVEAIDRAVADMDLYTKCINALNAPFDNDRIVKLRTRLIPLISDEEYFSPEQFAEMDMLDIRLSRYRGAVTLFRDIIKRINDDPVVKSYREQVRKGHPSAADRQEFIKAISAVVYEPNTKNFTREINSYIMIIPYLADKLQPYLNQTAQNPTVTSSVESEIMAK